MKRYFILFYTANNIKEGCQNIGNFCRITDGEYVNQKEVCSSILNDNKYLGSLVITNIIELTEQDFIKWR